MAGPGAVRTAMRTASLTFMAQVTLRMFASARVAAGRARETFEAATVGDVLELAVLRYGAPFADILTSCKVWRNGQPAARGETLAAGDEVAVLPPVSGG